MNELKAILNDSVIDLKLILKNVNKYSKRPKLLQTMFKKVCGVWSQDSEDRMLLALLVIVKALRRNPDYYSACTRSMYLTYVKNSKFVYGNNIAKNNLMKKGLLEVYALQLDEAYKHAFVFIRQLAISVRKAFMHSSKDEIRSVYNWQFICSLEMWCEFVARYSDSNELIKSLIHPLNTIILGAVRLSPGSRWIPIRFHFVECLHTLAGIDNKLRILENGETKPEEVKATNPVLVPSLPLLLDVFQLFDFNQRSSAGSSAPMDLRLMLHFSPSQRKQTACVDAVAAWLHDLMTESLCLYANSVAFPEYSASALTEIRQFLKSCKVANFTRNFKSLVMKVREQVDLVRQRRAGIKSLFEQAAIVDLESTLGQLDTPLLAYYVAHRRVRVHELSVLTERFKSEDMEHMKTEDAFENEMDEIPKDKDATKSSKRSKKSKDNYEEDSDEFDAESDASYDIDDGKTVTHVSRSGKKTEKSKKADASNSDSEEEDIDLDAALNEEEDLDEVENEDELKEFRIDDFEDSEDEEHPADRSSRLNEKSKEGESERLRRIMMEDPDLAGLDDEEEDDNNDNDEELMGVDMDDFSSGDNEDDDVEMKESEETGPSSLKVHRVGSESKMSSVNAHKSNGKNKKQKRKENKLQRKPSFKNKSTREGQKSYKKNMKRPRKEIK
ncbi:hypothetical protein Aperf_G00000051812 [Anoplocephala perfoliata]